MALTTQEISSRPQPTSTSAVPLVLQSGLAGHMVPLQTGVCFPKGQMTSASEAVISGFAGDVPAQVDILNRWNDGSVRWALLSFIAPEITEGRQSIFADGWATTPETELSASASAVTNVRIQRDELTVLIRDLSPECPRQHQIHVAPRVHDENGTEQALELKGVREECAGPVRQVFLVQACLQSAPFVTIQFRLTHWKAAGILQLETRLRNTRRARHAGGLWDLGDSGSYRFRSFEIGLRSEELPATSEIRWKVEQNQAERTCHSEVFLTQYGSGDRFWNSTNHVDADDRSAVIDRGFMVASEFGMLRGYRAEPTFQLSGDDHHLTVAVPEFWQNFPSGIGAAMGSLEVALFPKVAETTYELQGGEQKTQSFVLTYGTGPCSTDQLNWVHQPPAIIQTADSIERAQALPWFVTALPTADSSSARRLTDYLESATTGDHSLDARRASIDEYGWRNYGDVPADHEQTHYKGSNTVVSHYNNQFDMIYGSILQWLSTGDVRWSQLFGPLARHVMDIDIYHTLGDRAAFNGGLFWHTDHYVDARTCTHRTYSKYNAKPGQAYGGGPSCEHNYTTGLLHYYFLTGHPEARESVLLLADWVLRMDDGAQTIFGLFDDGPTGAASATVFEDFHGPGRGAGNSVNALLDAWILTGAERYLSKAEELIRRCVSPSQNLDELHLLDAEGHWSYTVFLNSMGRYLLAKRDAGQLDVMYAWARQTFAVYGRWMAHNERRTLDRPEELQYPTEAWAAQDFRKCNVMRIAATCVDDESLANLLHQRANEINDAAWKDLEAFGEARFTARCLSILMTEGHREVFHRTGGVDPCPRPDVEASVEPWTMFVPQKQRVRQLLKSPGRLLKSSLRLLNPGRLWRTALAAQRQFL